MRRLDGMFVLVLIGVPVIEVLVFVEVGRTVGWLLAVVLLLGLSVLGVQLLRVQGRATIERVSLAVSERRASGSAAVDGALGFLGALLLVIPGFVTALLGALLLFPLTRRLTRSWISRHYVGRVISMSPREQRLPSYETRSPRSSLTQSNASLTACRHSSSTARPSLVSRLSRAI
jgi:UPF0716 protein FxsA